MKNIAVVLAGGMGKRMCLQVPKQFLMLSGRTVIEYSIERFNSHPSIDEVCVVRKNGRHYRKELLAKTEESC